MNALHFLIDTVFGLYLMIVLLRFWLQLARADFYNPFSQFVIKATQPIIAPMRRVLPSMGSIDTASIVLALLVVFIKYSILTAMTPAALFDPLMLGVLTVVSVLKEAGVLLFWVLILRALLSWFNQGHNPIVRVMDQLTEPFLAPVRRILPPMGGLDLSVMLVLIAMNFLNILLAQYIPFWAQV
ncbi:YggT family protein [Shewanella sp. 3_MG-2023]|uniref:YggT family protein n=1 Tax=Shewanella sp. 3_MG-2023 TaxID=3062635 RepID=UPI0026E3EA22|nr:YggT family protein [Shewanella sp. 3_MG-2023]MDO6776626.1 YggT family protein [Shewanella sp. 3_MG-2023]